MKYWQSKSRKFLYFNLLLGNIPYLKIIGMIGVCMTAQ